jgi:hypothetical protein
VLGDPLVEAAIAVAAGVVFLWMFYVAVRVDWPEQYFATTDFSAYAISSSPLRYVLFRFAPVFVTCSVVAVSLDRRGSAVAAEAAFAVGLVHGSLTLGVALFQWARSDPKQRAHRASIAVIRAVALVGVLWVAVVAAATRTTAAFFIPTVRDLGTTLWTAGFAAVAGAFLVQYTRSHGITEPSLVARSLRSLPKSLRFVAEDECKSTGADIDLVFAIMAVENLQRPPWFRSLERAKSRLFKAGTYGIMQVTSAIALSDEESIRIAVRERLAKVNVKNRKGDLDYEALKRFATDYNGGPTYVTTLSAAYWTARVQRTGASAGAASNVTVGGSAASPSPIPREFKRAATKDQCMFCGTVIAAAEPAVAIADDSTDWVSTVATLSRDDVALAHSHCYALFRGLEGLARLKRTYDDVASTKADAARSEPAAGATGP